MAEVKPATVVEPESSNKDNEQVHDGASDEPQAYFEPVVKLDEIEVVSGEENEDIIFKM